MIERIGPDYVTLKHCNHCIFYDTKILCPKDYHNHFIQCYCKHPSLSEPKYIQDFHHTYVETRDWCPELKGDEE